MLVALGGCEGVVERLLADRPAVVVVRLWSRSSECERSVPGILAGAGYRSREVFRERRMWLVFQDDRLVRNKRASAAAGQ